LKERFLEALLFFLERPSVTGKEKALCDDLEARVKERPGWRVERVANNMVVGRETPDASRDRVVFAGHLDTVPEPAGGLPARVEGERVYGRGASDMKAGDAVMLALLEGFDWEGSWAEPVFVFYEREEGPYADNGLEVVFEKYPWVLDSDLALVPEPTENALEVGCVGTAQVEVTFRGKPAHSARPWQGEIVVEGLVFYEVLTPTMARGGRAKNVVPDEFWVNVNHRFAPGRGVEHVKGVFDGLLEGTSATYEVVDLAPSGSVDLSHPLLQRFLAADDMVVRPKQAWTDVARFAERGIAAANFGPGLPSQAHQPHEHVETALLVGCYEHMRRFL
jgi:succinyl-diaminopimelate desuccinylase